MTKKAIFAVVINGANMTAGMAQYVISIRVSDKAGSSGDTASIELDDRGGQIALPQPGALMAVSLGFAETGVGLVFSGTVDEVRSRGTRGGGMTVIVSAKGFDTKGKARQPQQRHFDQKTIQEILTEAGKDAGITDVKVDPEFASIKRPYERMDDESFVALGERLASELGGTFKISGTAAVLAKKNGGIAPGGAALAVVTAQRGLNLQSWDVAPFLGRARFKKVRARFYDAKEAKWKEVEAETTIEDADAEFTSRYAEPDEEKAKQKVANDKAESERGAGEGTVVIEGNVMAQPEGLCLIVGARPGIDGSYRIDSVDHEYSRGGFTTTLSLKQPQGTAGKDSRGGGASGGGGGDFSLPTDPDLG